MENIEEVPYRSEAEQNELRMMGDAPLPPTLRQWDAYALEESRLWLDGLNVLPRPQATRPA
ncbi:hypothetical protein Scep_017078 [Stephania cephalantha]|uniref:Uncharacterized protein n=1 Tax=Stephania cephalantha TaxID=152367 RepID=A0AAP0IPD8_9MAGN